MGENPEEPKSETDLDKMLKELGVDVTAQPAQQPAQPQKSSGEQLTPAQIASLAPQPVKGETTSIETIKKIPLVMKIEIGRTKMLVQDILKLSPGSIVELDKLRGDLFNIYINDKLVAKGELFVHGDKFAIRVKELVIPE